MLTRKSARRFVRARSAPVGPIARAFLLVFILALVLPSAQTAQAAGPTWTQQSPTSKPSARRYSAMANIGGDQVVLFGGYDSASDDETWVYDQDGLAVELAGFCASRRGMAVLLRWATFSEIDHAGFRVLRGEPGGELVNLTPRLIRPRAQGGELDGWRYRFVDWRAPPERVHY